VSPSGSRRAVVAAFLANLGIAFAKLAGFAITRSAAMLAESIHSLADTGNQALLLLGARRAERPADAAHPFGHGPAQYFWAFVVAMVLFTLGGVFAIFEGIEKVRTPHAIDAPVWAFVVLGISVVLESLSFRTGLREARPQRGQRSWWEFIHRTKSPELPVVLLEDFGALVGLAFALVGITLAEVFHQPRFDAIGSLAIGVLLVAVAIVLAIEMASLLIGESASPDDLATITDALGGATSVRRVIHMRTQHLGPDDVMVAAKIEFDPTLSIAQLAHAIDGAEARLRAAFPAARLVFIEPDLYRELPTSDS
jgi:cation diffusion facilitator family transporter